MNPFDYFLKDGFDPTLNQSEYGAPQTSEQGYALRNSGGPLLGDQTFLPGPFHYLNQVGSVRQPHYTFVSVFHDTEAFGGQVPLSESPTYVRPAPWLLS
jgi:hypothetical protein